MRIIVPLFVIIPAVELYLLHSLAGIIGLLETVLMVVVTGVLGGNLAKREGLRVWHAWQQAMNELRPPEEGVVSGLLVFIGGAFLITPGVLTDAMGFALLVPAARQPIANSLRRYAKRRLEAQGAVIITPQPVFPGGFSPDIRGSAGGSHGGVVDTSGEAVSDRDD